MAATTTRAKTSAGSRKSSASSGRRESGTQLQVRYFKRMKPNRVYGLTVSVPGGKKRANEDAEPGQLVVVRPVIAGAQVVPAEQRFEVAPGNQITFHVTPLARGRLPRARLEVFAPGQAPETIPLPMKAKTQRLALFLLLLAWLIPFCMTKLTHGSWKPGASSSLTDHFTSWMEKDLPPIPVFNQRADWLPEGWKTFTIASSIGDYLVLGYVELSIAMDKWPWLPSAVAGAFVFLAFMSWWFHKPARKVRKAALVLPEDGAMNAGEGVELQPI